MMAPSRTSRASAPRVMVPWVTMHPATPLLRHTKQSATPPPPQLDLPLLGAQHAGQGLADVVQRLVDHAVQAKVDALPLRQVTSSGVGPDVEADHHGAR